MKQKSFLTLAVLFAVVLPTLVIRQPGASAAAPQDEARRVFAGLTSSPKVQALRGRKLVLAELRVADESDAAARAAAGAFRASLETVLINSDFFQIVERGQLDRILREQKLQVSDLADADQVQKIGRLLNADLILLGEVTRAAGKVQINLRLVNVTTGIAAWAVEHVPGAVEGGPPGGNPPPLHGRILVCSQSRAPEDLLKKAGFTCDRKSILPENFREYDAILLVDWSSIEAGAGVALERYVEAGGGVVALGDVPSILGERFMFGGILQRPWMGITEMGLVFDPPATIELPDKLLGQDFSKNPITTVDGRVDGVKGHRAGGEVLATLKGSMYNNIYGAIYTYSSGKGRFYYQGTAKSETLVRALLAGIRWVLQR